MTQQTWKSQVITLADNPRSVHSTVWLNVEYNKAANPPIRIRVELPTGSDYVVPLTWEKWELMNTWVHSQLLEE